MVKSVNLSEWYGLLCDSTNEKAGDDFLKEMDGMITHDNNQDAGEHTQRALRYLRGLFDLHYVECRAMIGFVLAHKEEEIQFDKASFTAFHRHNIVGQITKLAWAGKSTRQEECKRRIREVCNKILGLVGYDKVSW